MSDASAQDDLTQSPPEAEAQRPPAKKADANDRSIETITDLLALEQEADRLRRSLDEKERTLESMTEGFRRLEDRLEDRHLAFDELKQEIELKTALLGQAKARIKRLEIDRQAQSIPDSQSDDLAAVLVDEGRTQAVPQKLPEPRSKRRSRFPLAALAIAGAALAIWLLADQSRDPSPPGDTVTPVAVTESDDEQPPAVAVEQPEEQAPVEAPALPDPLPTTQDRLTSGRLGPLLARVPDSRYSMGRNTPIRDDTGPAHIVEIPAFLIGVHEVTFDDYDLFARSTGRRIPSDFGWGRGQRPVIDVSWHDATAYANWLTGQTGQRYRLPSESEWELVASGGVTTSFWWGHYLVPGKAICFDCNTRWDNRSTAPVASLPPNPLGLHDTAGNAAEWVTDCYQPSYAGTPNDGRPHDEGACEQRVVRGGSFASPSRALRRFARSHQSPETRLNTIGFRIARDL